MRTHARVLCLLHACSTAHVARGGSLAPRGMRRLATVLRGLLPYKAYYVVQSKTSTKRQLGIIRLSHICCSIMLLLLFTLQRLSTSNYYFSASTTLCKSCLLLKTGLVINRTLVLLVFFFSYFCPSACVWNPRNFPVSFSLTEACYLKFPFLVDRQPRTFFLHIDMSLI